VRLGFLLDSHGICGFQTQGPDTRNLNLQQMMTAHDQRRQAIHHATLQIEKETLELCPNTSWHTYSGVRVSRDSLASIDSPVDTTLHRGSGLDGVRAACVAGCGRSRKLGKVSNHQPLELSKVWWLAMARRYRAPHSPGKLI